MIFKSKNKLLWFHDYVSRTHLHIKTQPCSQRGSHTRAFLFAHKNASIQSNSESLAFLLKNCKCIVSSAIIYWINTFMMIIIFFLNSHFTCPSHLNTTSYTESNPCPLKKRLVSLLSASSIGAHNSSYFLDFFLLFSKIN